MGRRYLIDTNIFLEILLLQTKEQVCKKFIQDHSDEITINQFTLNSIGISCNRNKHTDLFTSFLNDVASFLPILTFGYSTITSFGNKQLKKTIWIMMTVTNLLLLK